MTPDFQALRKTGLDFYLFLVPFETLHEDITKVSDVTRNGGVLLATKGNASTLILKRLRK